MFQNVCEIKLPANIADPRAKKYFMVNTSKIKGYLAVRNKLFSLKEKLARSLLVNRTVKTVQLKQITHGMKLRFKEEGKMEEKKIWNKVKRY